MHPNPDHQAAIADEIKPVDAWITPRHIVPLSVANK
jgi:hypothetical protein